MEVLREDLQENKLEINILDGYSDITQKYETVKKDTNKENVAIIDDFELKKETQIVDCIDIQSENYKTYAEWAMKNEIDIVGKFKKSTIVSSNFATYTQRNKVINELYDKVMQKQYKGICIDFKEIDDINSFNRFLIEITPKFRESGLKVIVILNSQMEQEKVKNIVDFTI